jgi:hypothetical protein
MKQKRRTPRQAIYRKTMSHHEQRTRVRDMEWLGAEENEVAIAHWQKVRDVNDAT